MQQVTWLWPGAQGCTSLVWSPKVEVRAWLPDLPSFSRLAAAAAHPLGSAMILSLLLGHTVPLLPSPKYFLVCSVIL